MILPTDYRNYYYYHHRHSTHQHTTIISYMTDKLEPSHIIYTYRPAAYIAGNKS